MTNSTLTKKIRTAIMNNNLFKYLDYHFELRQNFKDYEDYNNYCNKHNLINKG